MQLYLTNVIINPKEDIVKSLTPDTTLVAEILLTERDTIGGGRDNKRRRWSFGNVDDCDERLITVLWTVNC